ncbi:MAG: hypothetical protein MUO53_00595 [Maribacter sp.]|nr:hypothetical protein [Maribacter sp.]
MNNLKKIAVALFLLVTAFNFGQKRPDMDKIKALKIAFITERLDLSSKEAQAFWPLYNKYEENREAMRQKDRTLIRGRIRGVEGLTEKEAIQLLEEYIDFEEEEERLDTAFYKEVAKVISAKKALLLLRSEEDFKRQLIKEYRQKHGGGGGFD